MNNKAKAVRALSRAKIGLMHSGSAFLCVVAFSLRHKFSDEIPTACTDGLEIIFNPDFLLSLTGPERITLLAHETWHVALTHMTRREERDPQIYNHAGDYVINQLLLDGKFEPIIKSGPKGETTWLQDDKYRGMTTNQVYDLIKEETPSDDSKSLGQDITYPGDDDNGDEGQQNQNGKSPGDILKKTKEIEAAIKSILVKAVTQARLQKDNNVGNIPAEITREIDRLLNPIMPWNALLQQFLTDKVKNDYAWTRPNRRFLPDFYLPSQYSDALGHITIAIDTSGSVDEEMMVKMLSEIEYIRDTMKPNKLTILDCDYSIHNIHDVSEDQNILDLKFYGGGGTRCKPVMDYCEENDTTVLLYFTDLYMSDSVDEVSFPLMWITYDNPNAKVNVGEVIHYEI